MVVKRKVNIVQVEVMDRCDSATISHLRMLRITEVLTENNRMA